MRWKIDRSPSLTVWRDSVHAGDDADAPHEIRLSIDDDESLDSVIDRLAQSRYLPGISGGRATWILESGSKALAVIAEQWPRPRFLVPPERPAVSFIRDSGRAHLNFQYWCQADPDQVFQCLKDGSPLPTKYG